MSESPAVGIDLGTTFSCAAVIKNGLVQPVINGQGHYVTPSWVTFTGEEILVGEPAKIAAAGGNGRNAIFNVKRFMGRSFDDWSREYDAERSHWPFTVVNQDGKPFFSVRYKGKEQTFSPEQISSFILKELKKSVENCLQQPVKNAVISVPANFNYAQRESTEKAARLAGFNVLRLCSEPAMAGIMHEPLKGVYEKKTTLVFDCGGGTTDVAILSISENGAYDIVSTAGNMNLGGENLVDRLVSYFLRKLKEETGTDFSTNEEAVRRLKMTCEEAKCQLSFAETYQVSFDYQCEPKSWELTRSKFNELMSEIFEKMLDPVQEAIEGAGLVKAQIDEVLLAGGTSRVLEVQARLFAFFEGKPLRKSISPELAIAQGAAVMAALLSGDRSSPILSGRQLYEVAPLSVNVSLVLDELYQLVPRNTALPFKVTKRFFTDFDNQPGIGFGIYEGERTLSSDCKPGYLGTLELFEIPSARRGEIYADLIVDVNASGIMQVIAVEPKSGKRAVLQLMSPNRQRDSLAVKNMVEDGEKNTLIDSKHRERLQALDTFKNAVYARKHREEDKKGRRSRGADISVNVPICEEALKWIDEFGSVATVDEINGQRKKFRLSKN